MKPTTVQVYEADVLEAVMQVLDAYNLLYTRNNIGVVQIRQGQFYRFGTAGWSDLIGVAHDGRFLAIECKRPGGKLSEKQKRFLDRVNREQGVGIVADSVASLLKQLKERRVV